VGKEIDRVKRERAQKSSRTTPQELQAQLETKRQDAINSIKEASPEELEGGNVSPFSTNYGNKYISGISREDVELKVNSAHALELEELEFGPPPTTGMTIVEEVPLFGDALKENIKPGVPELFESNPELANAVYETLRLNSLNMNSFMPKRHWQIGHIIDNPTEAANICDNTQIRVLNYVLDKFGETKERGTFYAKPVTIWAKSPINDKQIHHSTVAVRINDKVYLYDMPQSEYIEYISENKGKVIKKYKPRLIEYTYDNLKKYYGTLDENLTVQDETILTDALINIDLVSQQQKQEAQQQYSQYLDTIFPDSKVKEIVHHGSSVKIEEFEVQREPLFHFGTVGAALQRGGVIHNILLNIEELQHINDGMWFLGTEKGGLLKLLLDRGILTKDQAQRILDIKNEAISNSYHDYPGARTQEGEQAGAKELQKILHNRNIGFSYVNLSEDAGSFSYAVPKPEQIHILGSKKDIEGFKKFIGNENNVQETQGPPVRRIPKSKKTKTVLDIGIANVTKSEIESKIQENKDHHKDNCNGIIPF
jgi:hypothetical protein